MIRSKFFSRFIVVTLTTALLLVSGSRAIRVSALADPDPFINAEFAPIYDTEIIRIGDYLENNLSTAQFDVYWLMMGAYVAAQSGFSEYKLRDPYGTQEGIINWLKSCGIQLYNSLIGLGVMGTDPITGIDYRPLLKGAADIAMGAAVKASTYEDMEDFLDDVSNQEKFLIPFMPSVQTAMNYVFARENGLYNWQFENSEFETTLTYNSVVLTPTDPYWTYIASFTPPLVRVNLTYGTITNFMLTSDFFGIYRNVLFNTTDQKFYFYSDDGQVSPTIVNLVGREAGHISDRSFVEEIPPSNNTFTFSGTYVLQDTYPEIVQYFIDHPQQFSTRYLLFVNDFVNHYYYGSSWQNKTEIFHSTDLNLDPNTLPYYQQITNNTLLDLKGILRDLLNTTDLTNVILNNLFDLDGVIVTDPQLIRVTTEILEEIQTINVPLPVNLNDIAEYTDNSFLDRVKEQAQRAGNTLANLVAFWHNCDAELIYILFGAGITVLVGAFIGKWGHS